MWPSMSAGEPAIRKVNMGHTNESPPSKSERPDVVGWEFVPLTDYALPTFAGLGTVVRKWNAVKALLRGNRDETLTPAKSESDLRALPQIRLENLAPPIDWAGAVPALEAAFSGRLAADASEPTVCFLIGQPWSGHGDILEKWATLRAADLIAPPDISDILRDARGWLHNWSEKQRLWVLPRLERCYLRHTNGLSLVRSLLGQALNGDLGQGVIGCDSWAWAYLQRVWPFAQPNTFTLQAFDGDKLARLFTCLPKKAAVGHVRFCHAKTGTPIIPAWEEIRQGDYAISKELRQLAAHCRGNPGTAWAYWRNRLRSEPDAAKSGSPDQDHDSEQHPGSPDTIWIAADMTDPAMPMEADEDMAIILHGLLLHDGLSADVLASILPLPHHRIMSLLLRLSGCELVVRAGGNWKVSALGYATVRRFLRERDYLTDQF